MICNKFLDILKVITVNLFFNHLVSILDHYSVSTGSEVVFKWAQLYNNTQPFNNTFVCIFTYVCTHARIYTGPLFNDTITSKVCKGRECWRWCICCSEKVWQVFCVCSVNFWKKSRTRWTIMLANKMELTKLKPDIPSRYCKY